MSNQNYEKRVINVNTYDLEEELDSINLDKAIEFLVSIQDKYPVPEFSSIISFEIVSISEPCGTDPNDEDEYVRRPYLEIARLETDEELEKRKRNYKEQEIANYIYEKDRLEEKKYYLQDTIDKIEKLQKPKDVSDEEIAQVREKLKSNSNF